MKEIGGYIEFERYSLPMLHSSAMALNCGRNCLALLIEIRSIKKILLPKFICKSIIDICKKNKVEIKFYSIDKRFLPYNVFPAEDEWLYFINYYGQIDNQQIALLKSKYKKIIVDQTHAYFQMPVEDIDTFYTCRKFLGVPDGAFLYTDCKKENVYPLDESYRRIGFLVGRFERAAEEFYGEYTENEHYFDNEPIKKMSKLTKNLLQGIDYARVCMTRTDNYAYLYDKLEKLNLLHIKKVRGAFMYPLYIENAPCIRKKLQEQKIYVPMLWPNIGEICNKDEWEYGLSQNILPLPCDQRYGESEMEYIVEQIRKSVERF